MYNSNRLPAGSAIDVSKPVNFSFDGKAYKGFSGDTLASALLANGVSLLGRSFKFHRPRGLLSSGAEECNAILTVGEEAHCEVNVRATQVKLYDGLVAKSQNCWPSAKHDINNVYSLFAKLLPAGFYLKTFMWPNWHWFEKYIRNAAGMGKISGKPDPDHYIKRFTHCDILIVGAGPAGIQAARVAADSGADVILVDEQDQIGGSLLYEQREIDDRSASRWLTECKAELSALENVKIITNCCAQGFYDENFVSAIEHLVAPGQNSSTYATAKQRLWKIRATQVILATGALERPLVFPNNDRPGIMLSSAAQIYVSRYGVQVGKKIVFYTNNDSAYQAALEMQAKGINIAAIIDVRADIDSDLVKQATAAGITQFQGHAIVNTAGHKGVKQVEISALNEAGTAFRGGDTRSLSCDLLCMSGGWNPTVHLYSQAGGKLRYNEGLACFVPASCEQAVQSAGASNGEFSLAKCLREGMAAGEVAVEKTGFALKRKNFFPVTSTIEQAPIQPFWQTPNFKGRDTTHKQFIDFIYDVTAADIALSARENFSSVEHLKRYTATGMAIDQGKTSNVNALAVLGQTTNRVISDVGTTKFRPPYQPISIGALAGNRVGALAHCYRQLPVTWHGESSAQLEDHSGWMRSAFYALPDENEEQAITREVTAARNDVTLFDSSSLGKIEIIGPDAAEFLNRLYINNVKSLKIGKVRYGIMLNDNGVIIDDGVFARLAKDHFIVTTSSAGALSIHFLMQEWLQCEWFDLDVQIIPVTAQWSTLTISGPKAHRLLQKLPIDLGAGKFPHMSLKCSMLEEVPLRIFRVSFTGEASYELNIPADYAESLWRLLLDLGAEENITPLGMEALNVLRIEKGFLEVGVDTDGNTSPLSVGWAHVIRKKTADFIGKRALAREYNQRDNLPHLVGVMPRQGNFVPPVGTHLKTTTGDIVGHITSSCYSPSLERSIAMAMVEAGLALKGSDLLLDVDAQIHMATITDLGFYDPNGEKLNA